jgi:peptidoglycan/LPS O-acetylase OafA/YrhL
MVQTNQYRPDIDGLRAITIAAVVAFHVGLPGVTGGFVGVDIFFVLSGFLITSMLYQEAMQTGRISLQAFYARRVRRLLPASCFVLIVSTLLAYFYLTPIGYEQLLFARSAAAAALFSSNIYFWKTSGGYFDGPSDQIPLLHTWSLSVEEQFYLVWPLLLIAIVRFSNWCGIKLRNLVLLALTVMFVGSLTASIYLSRETSSAGFYLLPSRVWELAAGAILGVLLHKKVTSHNPNQRWFAELCALSGLLAIGIACFNFDKTMSFPGWVAILPVAGTVALILSGSISNKTFVFNILSTKPMVWLGKLSYGWYLWHWPLLAFLKIENFGEYDLTQNLIISFIALILAYLTFRFIENPIRFSRPGWFATDRGALKMGALLILSSLTVAALLLGLRSLAHETTTPKQLSFAYTDFSPLRFKCSRDGSKPLQALNNPDCVTGNKNNSNTIVVWGDSHSDHWMPLLVDFFKNYQIIQYSMPGCPPLKGNAQAAVENCRPFNDQVMAAFSLNPNIKGVILAARWPSYIGSPSIQNKQKNNIPNYFDASAKSTQEALRILAASLDETLRTLDKSGLKILVMGPTPEFKYPVPECIFRKSPQFCQSSRAENDIYREKVLSVLQDVVDKHPNARLADAYEALCKEPHCQVIKNGQILYGDGDHLTGSGAKHALSSMQNEFAWFAQSQTK